MNSACSMALSTAVNFAGDGRSLSSAANFLAAKIVADNRSIIFRISVMETPLGNLRVEVGLDDCSINE